MITAFFLIWLVIAIGFLTFYLFNKIKRGIEFSKVKDFIDNPKYKRDQKIKDDFYEGLLNILARYAPKVIACVIGMWVAGMVAKMIIAQLSQPEIMSAMNSSNNTGFNVIYSAFATGPYATILGFGMVFMTGVMIWYTWRGRGAI
jgi:hypothetical protein